MSLERQALLEALAVERQTSPWWGKKPTPKTLKRQAQDALHSAILRAHQADDELMQARRRAELDTAFREHEKKGKSA